MKKIFTFVFAFAAAATLFIGCEKEINNQESLPEGTHTVTFFTEQETKTAVVENDGSSASYVWSSTEDAQYLHVYENGVEATSKTLSLGNGGATGTITATFPNSEASSFVYKAYYYGSKTNTGNPKVPETQSPKASSYDPQADVLISNETSPVSAAPANLALRFGRVAVISKMTLKGMVAGEVVSKVTLTGSAALNGSYAEDSVDSQTGDPVPAHWNTGTKKLIFENFENDTVNSNGEFPIYFVSIPFEGTISISVTTDQNQYERNDITTTLSFEVGKMARFGLRLNGYGEPINTGTSYSLVNAQANLIDGATYILVGAYNDNTNTQLYAMGEQKTNNRNAVAVEESTSGVITINNTVAAYPVIIEASDSYYTIKDARPSTDYYGQYLTADNTGKNYLHSTSTVDDNALWTIEVSNGVTNITNKGNSSKNLLCFNANVQSGTPSPLFSAYGNASGNITNNIALYIDPSSAVSTLPTPQNLAASDEGNGQVDVVWDASTGADSYTVTMTGQATKTGITSTSTSFTGVAVGTYTITVTAISNDHTVAIDYQAACTTVIVSSPTLGKPVIASITEKYTGFSAEIDEVVEYATSYDWDLYVGSVNVSNWIGTGNTTSLSFNVAFADTDITEFTAGETYLLVVTAKATGYTSTESDPESFVAVGPSYDFTNVAVLNALVT